MTFCVWKTNLTIMFPSNTGRLSIGTNKAIDTINPFKQLKCAIEFKLSKFTKIVSCKHFVWLPTTCLPTCLPACLSACLPACLPAHLPAWPQQSTHSLNYWALASILSQYEAYVFLSVWTFLIFMVFTSCSVSWLFIIYSAWSLLLRYAVRCTR